MNNNVVRVAITFLKPIEGGRTKMPTNPIYIPLVWFDKTPYSVAIEFDQFDAESRYRTGFARCSNDKQTNALRLLGQFDLYEGSKKVGTAVVQQ